MNKNFPRTILTPFIAIVIVFVLWWIPLGLDFFETIIATLVILVASFIEYRKKTFSSLGFKKFRTKDNLIIAPLISCALFSIYYFILIPQVTIFTEEPIDFSQFNELKGNLTSSIIMLAFIWISAGFGEEIIFRGYFMRQFLKFFGDGKLSIVLNIVLLAILFGCLHGSQGLTGQIITGIIGMLLAIIFYLKKYDLWFNIIIHGCFDTTGLILIYNGWI